MGCGDKKSYTIRRAVSSDGTTTAQFLTFLRLTLEQAQRAKISMWLEGSSGNLTVESAVIYANTEDGFTSATAASLPSTPTSRTANGASYAAGFGSLATDKQLAEIGVNVKNTSGTKREGGTVTLFVDLATEG